VATAIQFLDALAGESRSDATLALEVAGAYRRLAEISGDSRGAHLGDPVGAQRYAERAAALLEAVEAREPENLPVLREHRILALLLGRLRLEGGDANGVEETAKATGIAEKITRLPGADNADRRNLGATLAEYGGILAVVKDDHPAAAAQLARAVEVLEALVREDPADVPARASLAYAYERSAMAAEVTGRDEHLPRAVALQEKSIATTLSVVRDDALRVSHSQTLAKRYNNAARVKLRTGDIAGARDAAHHGRILIADLLARDPRDVNNASILAGAYAMESGVEYQGGRYLRAMELAREAIAADARLPAEIRRGLIVRENVMSAKRALGASACASPHAAAALLKEGRALLAESRAFKQELVARGIDAREAAAAIREIDAEMRRCDAALAKLAPA
jgi:hypothetical protein